MNFSAPLHTSYPNLHIDDSVSVEIEIKATFPANIIKGDVDLNSEKGIFNTFLLIPFRYRLLLSKSLTGTLQV